MTLDKMLKKKQKQLKIYKDFSDKQQMKKE